MKRLLVKVKVLAQKASVDFIVSLAKVKELAQKMLVVFTISFAFFFGFLSGVVR